MKFLLCILLSITISIISCKNKNSNDIVNYYYRHIVPFKGAPEGEIFKISIIKKHNSELKFYSIEIENGYHDTLYLSMVKRGKNKVSIREEDWKIFRDFQNCIDTLTINKWAIKDDSLFIENGLWEYPKEESYSKWIKYYIFKGRIYKNKIVGQMYEKFYTTTTPKDTFLTEDTYEAIFQRQP